MGEPNHIRATQALAPTVATTLEVLAAEIELAGARCIFLDRVIGQVMDHLEGADRERMLTGLHGVDLLAQHLTGLSTFARSMSLTVPANITAPADEALAGITLGALAERLSEGLGGVAGDGDEFADAGDVDLF